MFMTHEVEEMVAKLRKNGHISGLGLISLSWQVLAVIYQNACSRHIFERRYTRYHFGDFRETTLLFSVFVGALSLLLPPPISFAHLDASHLLSTLVTALSMEPKYPIVSTFGVAKHSTMLLVVS
jgi:hypothetical protein